VVSGIDELERTVASVCDRVGVELVDVELVGTSLQVTVERDGGLDLDEIAEAARAISDILDERDDLVPATHYELEVSSPGVERRLRRPEHFRRVVGSVVSLRTRAGVEGDRRLEGTLERVDAEGFTLQTGDGPARQLRYDDVERARTVFDWKAALRAADVARSDVSPSAHTGVVAPQHDGEVPE
jgi:ribosome maturation factor RimP